MVLGAWVGDVPDAEVVVNDAWPEGMGSSLRAGLAALDAHPDVDPQAIRFTDLHRWVLALPGFRDDPNHSGEKILEAIQMAWIDEA